MFSRASHFFPYFSGHPFLDKAAVATYHGVILGSTSTLIYKGGAYVLCQCCGCPIGEGRPKTILPIVEGTEAAILEKAVQFSTLPAIVWNGVQIGSRTAGTLPPWLGVENGVAWGEVLW